MIHPEEVAGTSMCINKLYRDSAVALIALARRRLWLSLVLY